MACREGICMMANKKKMRALIEDMYRAFPDCEFSLRPKKMKALLLRLYCEEFAGVDDIDMEMAFNNQKRIKKKFPVMADIYEYLRNNETPTSVH